MTSKERQDLTAAEFTYILDHGRWPALLDMTRVRTDELEGLYFYLQKHEKTVARITRSKSVVHVRKDTVYKPLFIDWALRKGFKVVELDGINTIGHGYAARGQVAWLA